MATDDAELATPSAELRIEETAGGMLADTLAVTLGPTLPVGLGAVPATRGNWAE